MTAVLGILHPGSMGAAIAAQARAKDVHVLWCSYGRSESTRERARAADLTDVKTIERLTAEADIILSVCPPAYAEDVATAVRGFRGIYVDANAIAPERMTRLASVLTTSARGVVDGSVIGSPPSAAKTARLYVAGHAGDVDQVADLFDGTAIDVRTLGAAVGSASALKMAYSQYQKASRVLAAVSYALAADHGVEAELMDVAAIRSGSYLTETDYIPKVAARSWRWSPEMNEVADALRTVGLPAELADATATAMARWHDQKDTKPTIREALDVMHRAL